VDTRQRAGVRGRPHAKREWLAKGGYGAASVEHSVRITPKTAFNIASVSKQFTAATLLRLVDEGRVRLDDDVRKYVPEFPESSPPTTLTGLVYQTSGLGDYTPVLYRQGKTSTVARAEVLEIIVKSRGSRHRASSTTTTTGTTSSSPR
jgi:CubicO group peptidase (beta-lactamase class C family)